MALKRRLMAALALGGALMASGARAQADATAADVRCLVVLGIVSDMAEASNKPRVTAALTYYLGRLDGRTPSLDLEAQMAAEGAKLSPQDLRAEAVSCGQAVATRGEAVRAIGDRLKAMVQGQAPAPK